MSVYDDECSPCACSIYVTGYCECDTFRNLPTTTDALVARAERDLAMNRLAFAKHLWATGRLSEWSLLWKESRCEA